MSYHGGSSARTSSTSNNRRTANRRAVVTTPVVIPPVAPPGYHYMPDGSLMLDSQMQVKATQVVRARTSAPDTRTASPYLTKEEYLRKNQDPNAYIKSLASTTVLDVKRKVAPLGYHYMENGALMSDAEHALLSLSKIIQLNIDLSPIPESGEVRSFTVSGDIGGKFALEIINEDGKYYNFNCNEFQVAKYRLSKSLSRDGYKNKIIFPAVGDPDQYDIYFWAEHGSEHGSYNEIRYEDGTVDINSSSGSNSLLLQKVIYQNADVTLTVQIDSPTSTIETGTQVTSTFVAPTGSRVQKTPFKLSCAVTTAAKCYRIIRQPNLSDTNASTTVVIGSPIDIPGENIYPTATAAFTGDDINGAVTSGAIVQIDADVAGNVVIGDKITTPNVFNLSTAVVIADGTTLTFSSKINRSLTTVRSLDPAEGTNHAKKFTMSQDIQFRDNAPLTFFNQMNYKWSVDDISGLKVGQTPAGTNITANSVLKNYKDSETIFACTDMEREIINIKLQSIEAVGKPTITKSTGISVQPGNIIFSKQQAKALASDSISITGYGIKNVKEIYGYNVKFSDLKIELTEVTTTTTSAVENSTSVPVAERAGILDDVSVVSGIGINPAAINPTVDTGAGAVTGAGTLVLTSAQTLEEGATLTFSEAGQTATITGNIEVLRVGSASQTIKLDIEKLVSIT